MVQTEKREEIDEMRERENRNVYFFELNV